MRRALGVLLVLVVAATCGRERTSVEPSPEPTVAASATPTPAPTPDPNPPTFRTELAMAHVRALAVDIGSRQAGSDGDRKGVDRIASALEGIGWDVTRQTFPLPQGGTSTNVIGDPPGFNPQVTKYLIVGGHHDSLNGPGANDNATGIAASLEIARAVQRRAPHFRVRFVAFGAEERQPAPGRPHHVGSEYYVSKMSEAEKANLVSFVNLDMIGHGDVIRCGRMSVGPREGTERCLRIAREQKIAVEEYVAPNYSDHGSFQTKGMNTTWVWTGELDCCYHNPRDTFEVVREADVGRSGTLALAIIRSYTQG